MNILSREHDRVRAIIINAGRILLIHRVKSDSSYWVIPGGGVELNESHQQAIERECREEIGVEVEMGKLFLQRTSDILKTKNRQEFFYLCDIVAGEIGTGQGPEFQPGLYYEGEHIIEWVELDKLENLNLKPEEVKIKIINQKT
jgi:8-oxo-dGTP diphosphatase